MLTLVNILIVFFVILICFQIILANRIVEGLETNKSYNQYDNNNPENALILAQKNAGNIEYLNDRIKDTQGMYKLVQDLSGNVQTLQEQVNGLVTAQQQYATQMTGGTAPEISGALPPQDENS
jgi:predicted PurR-regulated permease PerM